MFDIIIIFTNFLAIIIAFFRGFIKEVFGLIGICFSMFLTINYYDYFLNIYIEYISSIVLATIFSTITVFFIVIVTIIIINSWLMYMLSRIRLGIIDRFAGILMGIVKGIVFSYLIFFITKVGCYTILTSKIEDKKKKDMEVMPSWFISSYSYKVFDLLDLYINEIIPSSTHKKIKDIGEGINKALHEGEKNNITAKKKNYNKNKKK